MSSSGFSRRGFVRTTAAASTGFIIVPRHVLGGPRYRAPSDTLNVAHIGVGGMGGNDVRGIAETGENIYALCDVDESRAAGSWNAFPRAKQYRDFRIMLEEDADSIDAVVISTPDHTHTLAGMMALSLGKPTRIQKPLARTIWEVRQLMQAAETAGVPTQMGNQGHAQEGTRQIREWYEAGAIGTIQRVEYWTNRPIWPQAIPRPIEAYYTPPGMEWDLWLGPAPERPYHPAYAPFKWRGWWDFGTGALGDIACHSMDAAFWTFDLGTPERVSAESTTLFAETAPAASRIEYDFPARGTRPALKVIWRDGNLSPARPAEIDDTAPWPIESSGQLWIGSEGKLFAGIYGENPRLLDADRDAEIRANPPAETYPRTGGVYAEFVGACKGGPAAGSDFPGHAGPLTEMVLLGNLAVRSAREITLDPATGAITNGVSIPEHYTHPDYRTGWGW